MVKKRSKGVTVFSWIFIIGGFLSILSVITDKNSYTYWVKVMPLYTWIINMVITFLLEDLSQISDEHGAKISKVMLYLAPNQQRLAKALMTA